MRKRINVCMICSSDHYYESKKAHRDYIRRSHENFVELDIEVSITVKHRYYTKCFGKLIEITEEQAITFKNNNINIIEL